MIAYRNISQKEMEMLLVAQNPIYGSKRYQDFSECGCSELYPYGIVCFFAEPYAIKGEDHWIQITVNLKDPLSGTGRYLVSKDFQKTRVFTYRGKQEVYLPEYYARSYSIEDVVAINLRNHYANHYVKKIERLCKKHNIALHNSGFYMFDLKA